MHRVPVLALFLASSLGAGSAAAASEREARGDVMSRALAEVGAKAWDDAAATAARLDDPVAVDLVLWNRLREGAGTWEDYTDFLARNPDWPALGAVRRAGERFLPVDLSAAETIAYFGAEPPQTGTGALRLASALAAAGRTEEAEAAVVAAWRTLPMSAPDQAALLAGWEAVLAEHHVERIDAMLWEGWFADAERMLPLVGADWKALARARIMTRRDEAGLMAAIAAVPAPLRSHPGLAYERYLYRTSKGRWDEAEDYLREASTSAEALGRPEMWMERRANLARQALRAGDVEGAYAIAANNFGSEGADWADAEWVAGFIALEVMDEPERAVAHFTRFGAGVATPISLGRAGYWLGRAHARAGDVDAAQAAHAAGGAHQTSFYGQLAAEAAGLPVDPALAGGPEIPNWRAHPVAGSSLVAAAMLLLDAGYESRATQFLRQAAEGRPPELRAALAQMARDLGHPHIGLRIAKDAARDGVILPEQYYPLHAIAAGRWPVPTEFALAVARQESELNPAAESPAGARGLMQLMPRTAEDVAAGLGVAYAATRLTRDPDYNARLGTEYLARMLARYDGSFILAAAAYNAGPGRVDRWIEEHGDPRAGRTDPVVWIESIPFSETRNYVMRVMEGLQIYRVRLTGEPGQVRLAEDIAAGD